MEEEKISAQPQQQKQQQQQQQSKDYIYLAVYSPQQLNNQVLKNIQTRNEEFNQNLSQISQQKVRIINRFNLQLIKNCQKEDTDQQQVHFNMKSVGYEEQAYNCFVFCRLIKIYKPELTTVLIDEFSVDASKVEDEICKIFDSKKQDLVNFVNTTSPKTQLIFLDNFEGVPILTIHEKYENFLEFNEITEQNKPEIIAFFTSYYNFFKEFFPAKNSEEALQFLHLMISEIFTQSQDELVFSIIENILGQEFSSGGCIRINQKIDDKEFGAHYLATNSYVGERSFQVPEFINKTGTFDWTNNKTFKV